MVDLIEKLSQKQDEIEMRQKYRIASEQQKDGSIIPEKSLQTCKLPTLKFRYHSDLPKNPPTQNYPTRPPKPKTVLKIEI